jgi:cyclase
MRKIRVIPRLDIKFPNLIKGIRLEGLRVVGNPADFALDYYVQGADELLYMDAVASLYERSTISDFVEKTASNLFIPLTVGGGMRDAEDAKRILRAGADKVAINTAALKNPGIISEISESFGNQCVVLSIEAKKIGTNTWEAYYDNGREKTGIDVMEWVDKAQKLGVGEIIVTSIDQEGTQKGFEIDLIKRICALSSVPVIASGGMGELEHIKDLLLETSVDAIAIAHVLHYKKETIASVKNFIKQLGFEVRTQ